LRASSALGTCRCHPCPMRPGEVPRCGQETWPYEEVEQGMASASDDNDEPKKMKRKVYEAELERLQSELCMLQDWVKYKGLRIIIIFEGRDAAGKGGTIKAITERVSPRVFRVVALPAPSDREKSQMYMQRYMQHFPAAGEIVIFDRSWYN